MKGSQSSLPPNIRRAAHLLEKMKPFRAAWEEIFSLIEPAQNELEQASQYAARSRAYVLGTARPVATRTNCIFQDAQTGVCFDEIFGPCLRGASHILIQDPYIDRLHTARNLMEFIETIYRFKHQEDEVVLHLITKEADPTSSRQAEYFDHIRACSAKLGICFTWEMRPSQVVHDRYIETDTGWMITLDRGLDVFKKPGSPDVFEPANRLQEFRPCRRFSVSYLWRAHCNSKAVLEGGDRCEDNI